MAKLIPGKLRMEGVTLYETGNIEIIKEKGNRLYTRVAGEDLRYSLEFFGAYPTSEERENLHFVGSRPGGSWNQSPPLDSPNRFAWESKILRHP